MNPAAPPRAAIWRAFRQIHRDSRRTFRPANRGMTLLEMMIVLAILAIVMGLLVGPAVIERWNEAKVSTARMAVTKLASEAYVTWAATHPGKPCPDKIEELAAFTNQKDTRDPWGSTYRILCGSTLPPDAHSLAISSPGPDGQDGTHDDLRSWN